MRNTKLQEILTKRNKLKSFQGYIAKLLNEKENPDSFTAPNLQNVIFSGNILEDNYTRKEMLEKLENIASCCSIVELREYDSPQGKLPKIHNANYCHNPVVCSCCGAAASSKRKMNYSDPIKKAAERYKFAYFVTATIKDDEKLQGRIDKLVASKRKMRLYGQKRSFGNSFGEYGKIKAGISNIEQKIGENSGQWHVHEHSIYFTDEPLDYRVYDPVKKKRLMQQLQRKLTKEELLTCAKETIEFQGEQRPVSVLSKQWYHASGEESLNIQVDPLFKMNKEGEPVYEKLLRKNGKMYSFKTAADSIAFQAAEVLKYSTKLSDGIKTLTPFQFVEVIQRRGRRRLLNTLGDMRCDKRNPNALQTVEEKELKKQEYKIKMDSMTYEVYSSIWKGDHYSKAEKHGSAVMKSSDLINTEWIEFRTRIFRIAAAQLMEKYRSWRNRMMRDRDKMKAEFKEHLEKMLDDKREQFRGEMKMFWSRLRDPEYFPYITC